jgi:hypothetical protein
METAIQILIDYSIDKYGSDSEIANDLICKAMLLKKEEKEQIIDAHCNGQDIEDTAGVSDAIDYFKKKYKK